MKHSGVSSRAKEDQRFGDLFLLSRQGLIASRLSLVLMPFRPVNCSRFSEEQRTSTITIQQ